MRILGILALPCNFELPILQSKWWLKSALIRDAEMSVFTKPGVWVNVCWTRRNFSYFYMQKITGQIFPYVRFHFKLPNYKCLPLFNYYLPKLISSQIYNHKRDFAWLLPKQLTLEPNLPSYVLVTRAGRLLSRKKLDYLNLKK